MEDVHNIRKFVSPEIIFGNGSRLLIPRYINNFEITKPMIVSDPGVITAGWLDDVTSLLKEHSVEYVVYDGVTSNPKDFEVMQGADFFYKEKCDAIIAIGGGSPMDCAKGIGIVVSNGGHILDYEGVDQITSPCPPMIFIPTTAGTSADVSQFAIIKNTDEKLKIAIISKAIVPDVSLVDPITTKSMDHNLTAATGMDVLTHAIEAYVSNASSFITDLFALEAVSLVATYLENACQHLDDVILREHMMKASLSAGLAFSNASLGAVHAMAHSLGGYRDSPHGECNSLLLPYVIHANFPYSKERYRTILHAMQESVTSLTDDEVKDTIIMRIDHLVKRLGLPLSLRDFSVSENDIPILSEKAVKDACMVTNPKFFTEEEVATIYAASL